MSFSSQYAFCLLSFTTHFCEILFSNFITSHVLFYALQLDLHCYHYKKPLSSRFPTLSDVMSISLFTSYLPTEQNVK